MTQYLSDKLRVLSLISIIFVLYIHSRFQPNEIMGMAYYDKIQLFTSEMIGRCAVPLFYLISGYLFFMKVPDGVKSIGRKIRKRIKSLLIPYFIGCVFFVIFYSFVALLPWTSNLINSSSSIMPLFQKPYSIILISIFYDGGTGYPCAFQLWFLRDLILIVATSPLWYLCLKHLKWGFVAVVFVLTYFDVPHVPFYSLFWFVLGGQLTKVKIEMGGNGRTKVAIFGLFLFLIISIIQLFFPDIINWSLLRIPIILLGIIGAWGLYDVVFGKDFSLSRHQWFATACQFTFFIYLFHEPTLNIVRKLIVVVLGKNELGYLTSYLISPWIFTVCAVFAGLLFRKYLPRVYDVCTGGR
jgi:surface polysaccharide O-acyltransferase-like enzyme